MAIQKNISKKKSKTVLNVSTKERRAEKRRLIAKKKKEDRIRRRLERKGVILDE